MIFEKASLACKIPILLCITLEPRVKVICDPCDIIFIILKEDYTPMLYTKNRDFLHSTFKETNFLLS